MTGLQRSLAIETIERHAREHGNELDVADLTSEPFSGSSSFHVERVTVHLASGDVVPMIFKDLHPGHQLPEAKAVRDSSLRRSETEVWAYQDVLSRLDVGTPELFGVRWEPEFGRHWMFIEDVGPKRLSRLGDFSLWVEAGRWLATLHERTSRLGPDVMRQLRPRTAESVDTLVERVERSAHRFLEEQQAAIRRGLGELERAFGAAESLPTTVTHGEYFGKNVVVREAPHELRIAVIDWETIGIGPLGWDLASISAGRWTREQRHELWLAYYDAAFDQGLELPIWSEFRSAIAGTAVVHALWWLAFWSNEDETHKERWVRELEAALQLQLAVAS